MGDCVLTLIQQYAYKDSFGDVLIPYGEPRGPNLEHLIDSIIQLYCRLKDLGFTYYNGVVTVIDTEADDD